MEMDESSGRRQWVHCYICASSCYRQMMGIREESRKFGVPAATLSDADPDTHPHPAPQPYPAKDFSLTTATESAVQRNTLCSSTIRFRIRKISVRFRVPDQDGQAAPLGVFTLRIVNNVPTTLPAPLSASIHFKRLHPYDQPIFN